MRLNAPKKITWWISLIIAIIAVLVTFITVPFLSVNAFWVLLIAFLLVWLGSFVKGL